MKKNVLTILAVTGTFSVIYLLYKYKRRSVKKRNIGKAMEADAGLNSLEKENILYKVYVNDSAVVRVCSGEENINGDITNFCNNSITEHINLEKGSNIIEDSIAAIYSLDFVVNENLASPEANSINLTELNMSEFLNCSNNSFDDKGMRMSFNNLINGPNLGFLDTNGEDTSDITFLSPSIINLESVDEIVNEEMLADISDPQKVDTADKNLVGSFNELNLKDLNSNVNIENGKSFSTSYIDNSVEGKQCNLNKLNTEIDNNTQGGLSLFIDNAINSVAELNGENHSTNLNLHSIANRFENANSTPASNSDVNCDIPKVLNEPNLNNEVKQESCNVNGKKKRRRRKKKNSDSDSSSRSSSSENNGNSSPTTKLNIEEVMRKSEIDNVYLANTSSENHENLPPKIELNIEEMGLKNEINNLCLTNSISENNGHSQTTTKLNIDEMFPKNEIDNLCFTDSSFNPCDNINVNKNEGTSVCEIYSISEGPTICEEAYPKFKGATICEEVATSVGSSAVDNSNLACETSSSSLFLPVPAPEPQSLAKHSQCLPEMNGAEADHFIRDIPYEFPFPRNLAGRLIGKSGSFRNKVEAETNVSIIIVNHETDETVSICRMRASSVEGLEKSLKMVKERLPSEVAIDYEFPGNNYNALTTAPFYPQTSSICGNEITIPIGVSIDICVSSIQSVGEIWIQQPQNPLFGRFISMQSEMRLWYGDGSKVAKLQYPVLQNTLAVCKLNGEWCRCLVIVIEKDDACVKLLDIGGYVRLPVKHLRQPMTIGQPPPFQATLVYLYGLEPTSGSESYSEEGEAELISLVQNKKLIATVDAYSATDRCPIIKLFYKTEDEERNNYIYINKELVDRGYARWAVYVPDEEK